MDVASGWVFTRLRNPFVPVHVQEPPRRLCGQLRVRRQVPVFQHVAIHEEQQLTRAQHLLEEMKDNEWLEGSEPYSIVACVWVPQIARNA